MRICTAVLDPRPFGEVQNRTRRSGRARRERS